ncbi:tryptophan aminotransferase-related protein 1-like [Hordeum vulgare subsp. vulgare]|uniref:Alliinase C-terminal domain-containing protein n=1 Tax=Hordeum vulgare subsp. vulgare TaxID=112509 RepID=A0A8I6X845_HORVV|nr:tryptophan aminotransferase-related protein 1-like [Hordeum vulgare subsp. vulgare]
MARDHGDGLAAIAGRIGVVGSVALNLVALVIYLRGHFFSSVGTVVEKRPSKKEELAVVAPSCGKPSVLSDSMISLDHGDPTMFETFWRGPIGKSAMLVIPGWQTMSYFSDVGNLCWFLEPGLEREVRRLHRLIGNAAVEGYHVLVGTGSMQLFQSALYALAPPIADSPISVVSHTPFYSSYPSVTDFLDSRLYRWAGDANTFDGDNYIEVVCSPNNPDGAIRETILKSKTGKAIHDLAYYWPQYTPITQMLAHDIMLFTVSKCTGHAGTRIGWALVKDKQVAQKMNKFMELNTIGVSKDAQLRAAKILGAVADGYEFQLTIPSGGDVNLLFHYARRQMAHRWRALRAAVAVSGIFSLPGEVGGFCTFTKDMVIANPAFAWLRCEKEEVEDLESFLREHKIITRSGTKFGVDRKVVRISMVDTDEAFNIFVDRLATMK